MYIYIYIYIFFNPQTSLSAPIHGIQPGLGREPWLPPEKDVPRPSKEVDQGMG